MQSTAPPVCDVVSILAARFNSSARLKLAVFLKGFYKSPHQSPQVVMTPHHIHWYALVKKRTNATTWKLIHRRNMHEAQNE